MFVAFPWGLETYPLQTATAMNEVAFVAFPWGLETLSSVYQMQ